MQKLVNNFLLLISFFSTFSCNKNKVYNYTSQAILQQFLADISLQDDSLLIKEVFNNYNFAFQQKYFKPPNEQKLQEIADKIINSNSNSSQDYLGKIEQLGVWQIYTDSLSKQSRIWLQIEWEWLLRDSLSFTTETIRKELATCACWGCWKEADLPTTQNAKKWECKQGFQPFQFSNTYTFSLAQTEKYKTFSVKNSPNFNIFAAILAQNNSKYLEPKIQELQSPAYPCFQINHHQYKIYFDTFNNRPFRTSFNNFANQTNEGTLLYKYNQSKFILLNVNDLYHLKAWSPCQKEPLEYKDIAAYAWLTKPSFIYRDV